MKGEEGIGGGGGGGLVPPEANGIKRGQIKWKRLFFNKSVFFL